MLRMQVYLPEETFINLKARAKIEDVSMSDLVRKGLKKVLSLDMESADPMKEFVGKFRQKKKTDGVKEINNYYKKIIK